MWRPGGIAPSSSALAAAGFIQRSAVDLDDLTSLSSSPTLSNWSALASAACSSACIGTILALLPLPCLTRMVGRSVSSDRSRVSTASASEILRPARHSMRNSSRALGLGAARMSASTSWASRYSGSCPPVFLVDVATWIGMLAPGAAVAIDGCGLAGCQSGTSLSHVCGTFSPSDCLNLGRGLQVLGAGQLGGGRPNGTFGLILSRCFKHPYRSLRRTLRSPATSPLVPADPADQVALPILNNVAPHSPHMPRVAARPVFIVTCWALWISRLSRHFKQYPVIAVAPCF